MRRGAAVQPARVTGPEYDGIIGPTGLVFKSAWDPAWFNVSARREGIAPRPASLRTSEKVRGEDQVFKVRCSLLLDQLRFAGEGDAVSLLIIDPSKKVEVKRMCPHTRKRILASQEHSPSLIQPS